MSARAVGRCVTPRAAPELATYRAAGIIFGPVRGKDDQTTVTAWTRRRALFIQHWRGGNRLCGGLFAESIHVKSELVAHGNAPLRVVAGAFGTTRDDEKFINDRLGPGASLRGAGFPPVTPMGEIMRFGTIDRNLCLPPQSPDRQRVYRSRPRVPRVLSELHRTYAIIVTGTKLMEKSEPGRTRAQARFACRSVRFR